MEIVRTGSYAKGVKRLLKLGASEQDILEMEDAIAPIPMSATSCQAREACGRCALVMPA